MELIVIGLMALVIFGFSFAYFIHQQKQQLEEMMIHHRDNIIIEVREVDEKVANLTQIVMRLDADVLEFTNE